MHSSDQPVFLSFFCPQARCYSNLGLAVNYRKNRMRASNLFLWTFLLAVVVAPPARGDERPNIVFVMADDLGLGDVSHYVRNIQNKEPLVETPTIDALARLGIWFTDGHSATSLCASTRYAVMSGNNNYRSYAPWGVWSTFGKSAFKKGHATLGSVVRDAGYSTGFVGKWHLGGDFMTANNDKIYRGKKVGDLRGAVDLSRMVSGGPRYCGFNYDFTSPCGIQGPVYLLYENGNWWPIAKDSRITFLDRGSVINPQDLSSKGPGMGDSHWSARDMGKLLSSKAVEFIKNNANQENPFFLYYCSPMVHRPHIPPKQFDGKNIEGETPTHHLDMVLDFDMQVKRIVDALKSTGEFKNTLFVLTSDNGGLQDSPASERGYQPSGNFNGSKNSPLEGGHRVPTIAVWPGKVGPGVCDELVVNQDMVATFAALVGTKIPAGQAQDSNNLLPLLNGEGTFLPREYFANQAGSQHEFMLRVMPWKLIIQSNHQRSKMKPKLLFNLHNDPRELKNLVDQPEMEARVAAMLKRYKKIVESRCPTVNSK